MIHNRITGTTRVLGKSQGYLGLYVRDIVRADGIHAIQTSWEPTPDELQRLIQGKPLILTQLCISPPPMSMSVPE